MVATQRDRVVKGFDHQDVAQQMLKRAQEAFLVLDQAAGFKSVMIDRKKLLVKDLAVKPATPCTKKLTPVAKPAKTLKPQR